MLILSAGLNQAGQRVRRGICLSRQSPSGQTGIYARHRLIDSESGRDHTFYCTSFPPLFCLVALATAARASGVTKLAFGHNKHTILMAVVVCASAPSSGPLLNAGL